MRLKLTFTQKQSGQFIPLNYNYHISTFIYKTISSSSNEYSKWLHDSGFASGYKKFKFFTFSMLNIPKREITGNRIKILSDQVELTVSMLSEKSVENFVIGMFENQEMRIYDGKTEAEFSVKTIEALPDPDYRQVMKFKTLSPVMLSKKTLYNGKDSEYYLNPSDADYLEYFKRNLEEKYIAYLLSCHSREGGNPVMGGLYAEAGAEPQITDFKILNGTKSKLLTIKEGRADETKVRGYIYSFELHAAPEFMHLGYQTGFGKLNSLGFGCTEVI